jgi:CRP/FNR family transcriptional regulator, cyclic AMP receptor protein
LFPPYRWQFGAVAISTTNTITFDGPRVRALCQRDPALGYELTTRFCGSWVNGCSPPGGDCRIASAAAGHHLEL